LQVIWSFHRSDIISGYSGADVVFNEAETSAETKAAELDMKDIASYRKRWFSGQKDELLKDIPHEKNSAYWRRRIVSATSATLS